MLSFINQEKKGNLQSRVKGVGTEIAKKPREFCSGSPVKQSQCQCCYKSYRVNIEIDH